MKITIDIPEYEANMFYVLCPLKTDQSYWLRRRIEKSFTETMISLMKSDDFERLEEMKKFFHLSMEVDNG